MVTPLPSWLSSTLLADVGAQALGSGIKPLKAAWKLFGPALTVSVPPGDNLAIHLALFHARHNEILVIDGAGYDGRALIGDIMCTQASAAGIAGVVVDGVVRDVADLATAELPVFALGASPLGPFKKGGGSVLKPIECSGVAIAPGDWIFGDADGVVVLPATQKAALLDAAAQKLEKERARIAAIHDGHLTPAWLEAELSEATIELGSR